MFWRCAKGPNVSIDGEIYSLMSLQDVKRKLWIIGGYFGYIRYKERVF